MGFADEIFIGVAGLTWVEDVVDTRAPKAGPFEAEVISEFDDEIREERVEEEEDYENPFENGVDEDERDFVGSVMNHGCEFVGCHGWCSVLGMCRKN